jgi:subtilase family serine protease
MKKSSFVKILMLALAALVACQAGFAQMSSHAVVPSVAPGQFRPYVWMNDATLSAQPNPTTNLPSFCNTAYNGAGSFLFCPNALQSVYGANSIPSGNGGKGKTIAIVDAYHYANAASNLATFNTAMGLPQLDGIGGDPTLTFGGCTTATTSTPPSYGSTCSSTRPTAPDPAHGWELEEMLDLEWAHAMAPYANILMVEAADNGASLFAAVHYAAGLGDIVSDSWGGGEYSGQTADDTTFGVGKPILFSSGDSGKWVGTTVTPQYPCTSPNVTCVGGTTLLPTGSPLRRSTETAWSCQSADTDCATHGGSGGGCSTQESIPAYQNVGAIGGGNAPTLCGTKRAVPDIAAVADPNTGVAVYINEAGYYGGYYAVGGTSLATPVTAGLFAQIINARATFGQDTIQYFNPPVYAAALRSYAYFFFDVTSGNNGYPAGIGYDLVTGLGVSNAADMANRFFGLIFNLPR